MFSRDLIRKEGNVEAGKRAVGQRNSDVMLLASFLNLVLQASDLCLSACPGWEMTSPYSLLKNKKIIVCSEMTPLL